MTAGERRHRYFAYGSNLHRPQMAALAPSATVEQRALLAGWELFVTTHGVLSIRPARAKRSVLGLVWWCDDDDLAELDRFEAVDQGLYLRDQMEVTGDDGTTVTAQVYRATSSEAGRPRPGYLEHSVLAPMRELAFPPAYVADLESWLARGTDGPAWVSTPEPGSSFTSSG